MQNVIDIRNLPTSKIIDEFFLEESMSLLKKIRFGVGYVDMNKVKFITRLDKYVCGDLCLDKAQKHKIREDLLVKTILHQKEL